MSAIYQMVEVGGVDIARTGFSSQVRYPAQLHGHFDLLLKNFGHHMSAHRTNIPPSTGERNKT